jgi:hypothetical protein
MFLVVYGYITTWAEVMVIALKGHLSESFLLKVIYSFHF